MRLSEVKKSRKTEGIGEVPTAPSFSFNDMIQARLYNERTLVLSGEIEEYEADAMTTFLQTLSGTKDDITLLITSYGGAVDAGGAIIRAIRHAQANSCKVIGEVRGYAMSMAAVILQACDVRFAAPEDIIMVHGATGQSVGDIRNQEADVAMTKRLMDIHAKFFAGRSTSEDTKYHDEEYWRKLLDDNFPHYYFGHEALEAGLIDEVII